MTAPALIRLPGFDAPLPVAEPPDALEMRVLSEVAVDGMTEVHLAELLTPLARAGAGDVAHVAVSPRLRGTTLREAPFGGVPANIAFVEAAGAADRTALTAADVMLAGMGFAAGIPCREPAPQPRRRSLFDRLLGRAA